MKRNIALIDEDYLDDLDDERYNDPSENEDYSDFDDEGFNSQHTANCSACNGTGEGMASGYSCNWCNGRGYIVRKH